MSVSQWQEVPFLRSLISHSLEEEPLTMPGGWVKVPQKLPDDSAAIQIYEPKKDLPKGNWTFSLEMQTSKALGPRDEQDEYVQSIRGGIVAEQGRPSSIVKEIGQLEADVVQIRRIRDAGRSLSWVGVLILYPQQIGS